MAREASEAPLGGPWLGKGRRTCAGARGQAAKTWGVLGGAGPGHDGGVPAAESRPGIIMMLVVIAALAGASVRRGSAHVYERRWAGAPAEGRGARDILSCGVSPIPAVRRVYVAA